MSCIASNKPLIALVDCNNFYASCERVFNPHLCHKPLVILSNNDGCIIARSNEAKALGIPMGAPAFQYKELFKKHQVTVRSSNFALYGDMSNRVMNTLAQFAPDLQIYSIDEAFLMLDRPEEAAIIRKTVLQWTGIPVSIGLAPTKTLAKAANHYAKKNSRNTGVFIMDTAEIQQKILDELSVEDIWGIGRRTANLLKGHQIQTAWDLRNVDDQWIRKKTSVITLRTVFELRGISCLELGEVSPSKKSITCSRSFGKRLTDEEEIAEALSSYTATAAEKLREEESLASIIQVFLLTSPHQEGQQYYTNTIQIVLPQPTNYTPSLIHHAKQGLKAIFKRGLAYKKTGIILGGLVSSHSYQQDLFVDQEIYHEKQRNLMTTLDHINQKYGRKVLKIAAEGIEQSWKMKSCQHSPCYTTRWDEIPTIHI